MKDTYTLLEPEPGHCALCDTPPPKHKYLNSAEGEVFLRWLGDWIEAHPIDYGGVSPTRRYGDFIGMNEIDRAVQELEMDLRQDYKLRRGI